MKLVLSIDGGGIRGLIPAIVCKALEDTTQKQLCTIFDLLAGTSTGGIIALGLAAAIDADKLVTVYRELGPRIFAKPRSWLPSFMHPKYETEGLASVLREQLPARQLRDVTSPVMVTAYDLLQRQPVVLKSWDPDIDFTIREAARATSAAPTYFAPAKSANGRVLIDGGVYCNNPALLSYIEARRLWPDEQIFVLSLGTGNLSTSIMYEDASKWGLARWALPLLDCVFDGVSASTHNAMEYLAKLQRSNLNYSRLQVTLDKSCEQMDDTSTYAMTNLVRLGNSLVIEHEKTLCEIRDTSAARNKDGRLSPAPSEGQVDDKSKYRLYDIDEIVLDDLRKSGFNLDGVSINSGFTIMDLIKVCSDVYYPDVEKERIRDSAFRARAHAFTVKYSQPKEDEKLVAPGRLKVEGLAPWTTYLSEILEEMSIDIGSDRLIDVGAGHAQANVDLYRGARFVTLVDISVDALTFARESLPHAKTVHANAEDLSGIRNDSVDVYFSFRTYQSTLFDVRFALHEAYRILSRKGRLILSIPIMYPKEDGTVAQGLLRPGTKETSMDYAIQVAQRIAETAASLQFQLARVDDRSPFELFIVGQRARAFTQ